MADHPACLRLHGELKRGLWRRLCSGLDFDDPLWEPLAALASRRTSARHDLPRIADFLIWARGHGLSVLTMTREDVALFLGTRVSSGTRDKNEVMLRRLFAAARAAGLSPRVRHIPRGKPRRQNGDGYRASDEVISRLRTVVGSEADLLPAHARGQVLLTLGLWRGPTVDQLRRMCWRDVQGCLVRIPDSNGPGSFEVAPRAVLHALDRLRRTLAALGLEVVADDALICAIHPNLFLEWRADERQLVRPPSKYSLMTIIRRWRRNAGDGGLQEGAGTLSWLRQRSNEDVDRLMGLADNSSGRVRNRWARAAA